MPACLMQAGNRCKAPGYGNPLVRTGDRPLHILIDDAISIQHDEFHHELPEGAAALSDSAGCNKLNSAVLQHNSLT